MSREWHIKRDRNFRASLRTPLPAAVVCRFLAVGEGDVCEG
jgi:hypothetical protein